MPDFEPDCEATGVKVWFWGANRAGEAHEVASEIIRSRESVMLGDARWAEQSYLMSLCRCGVPGTVKTPIPLGEVKEATRKDVDDMTLSAAEHARFQALLRPGEDLQLVSDDHLAGESVHEIDFRIWPR